MSLGKVKRIEDPESFLRRSVLINNTIKRLQKEVREEKMMRHGGSYTSKLSSCSSYRKSFACSRLNEMHLSVVDEPDTDSPNSLLMDTDDESRPSPLDNLIISKDHHNTPSLLNSRKRPPSQEDSEEDCDVADVLSQIYVPPTPCIISSIDEDEANMLSASSSSSHLRNSHPIASTSSQAATIYSSTSSNCVIDPLEGITMCGEPPLKKSRLELEEDVTASLLTAVSVSSCSLDDDVDVDVDVDVVGDSELSDWPTPPAPITRPPTSSLLSSSTVMLSPQSVTSLSMSSLLSFSSTSSSLSLCSSSSISSSYNATGLGRVMTVLSDNACSDFPLLMDLSPTTRDSSESCPSPSVTMSTSSLTQMPTVLSSSSMCNGLMSPLITSTVEGAGLPLPLLSPTTLSINNPIHDLIPGSSSSSSSSSEESNSGDEDMLLSSETKENCSLTLSLPLSGLHSPLLDHNSKCSGSSCDCGINGCYSVNNNNSNANPSNGSGSPGSVNNNNSPSSGGSSPSSEMDKSQQYSSCGHSSIFGELQSTVFHNLIASLET